MAVESQFALETQVAVLENRLDTVEVTLHETHSMVSDIKARLDRQNGIIPHMADDIKDIRIEIKSVAGSLAQKTLDIADKLAVKTAEDAKSGTKLNIMWGIIASLFTAIVAAFAAYLFKVH